MIVLILQQRHKTNGLSFISYETNAKRNSRPQINQRPQRIDSQI